MRKTKGNRASLLRVDPGALSVQARSLVTVLHIDDDPNDAALLSAAVQKAGAAFLVEHVAGADQAMAYLSGTGEYADRGRFPMPALILLDLKMPCADGFELLRWIRSCDALRDAKVLILSGSELQEDIRQAYATGANSYFVKPIGFDSLVDLMRNINAFWLKNGPAAAAARFPGAAPSADGSSLSA